MKPKFNFLKKPKKENNSIMKMNSEVDNDFFFRQDFLNKTKISNVDETKVEDLVRIYNAEQTSP